MGPIPFWGSQPPLQALSRLQLVPRARLVLWGQETKAGFAFVLPGPKQKPATGTGSPGGACGRGARPPHTIPPLSAAQRRLLRLFSRDPRGPPRGPRGCEVSGIIESSHSESVSLCEDSVSSQEEPSQQATGFHAHVCKLQPFFLLGSSLTCFLLSFPPVFL